MDFEPLVGIFPQVLLDGLLLGFMYALIALGYTMVYGVLEFINFAHSEIFIVGAFVGAEILLSLKNAGALETLPWPLVLLGVMLAGMLASGALAVSIERIAYRPLRAAPRLIPLISAIGMSFFLQDVIRLVESLWRNAFNLVYPTLEPLNVRYELTSTLDVSAKSLVVIVAALLMLWGLHALVNRTKIGTAIRAVAEDQAAASLMGIDVNRIISLTFLIGGAMGGAAVRGPLQRRRRPLPPLDPALPDLPDEPALCLRRTDPGLAARGIARGRAARAHARDRHLQRLLPGGRHAGRHLRGAGARAQHRRGPGGAARSRPRRPLRRRRLLVGDLRLAAHPCRLRWRWLSPALLVVLSVPGDRSRRGGRRRRAPRAPRAPASRRLPGHRDPGLRRGDPCPRQQPRQADQRHQRAARHHAHLAPAPARRDLVRGRLLLPRPAHRRGGRPRQPPAGGLAHRTRLGGHARRSAGRAGDGRAARARQAA